VTSAQAESPASLNGLYEDYWEYTLRESPTYATYLGDHRYDDKLDDLSEEAYHRRIDQYREYLTQLKSIGRPSDVRDRLNFDLFRRELDLQIEGSKFHPYLLQLTQQTGPHIDLPQLVTFHPYLTARDYENYINRLRQFPKVFKQTIANLGTGMGRRVVQPWNVVEKILPQLEVQIVNSPDRSILHKPVNTIPSSITEEESRRLTRDVDDAIMGSVVPAYSELLKFVKDEYLPKSRTDPGVWALPNGRAMYAYSIRYHTTTNLTPAQIHRMGKLELARISKEIRTILRKIRFKGTLQKYNETLRKDTSNFYTNSRDLRDGFKTILRKMDEKLPLLFGRLPDSKYDFREIEEFRADAAPAAYYYLPPEDRSRPGYFYVNTYKPETRPKYTMEALAYHEAVPGHHLQLALQQELTGLPKFRRNGGYSAFIEGWALYAERLGIEIGLYRDMLSNFGRLTQEAWRAARLVVDTGIHSMKWTREHAIRFLKENTATTEQDIVSEVDRYIAWPGQALAYKIGEMKIRSLRSRAEKKLRRRFQVRNFHDELLNDGALPLDLLEKKMSNWLTKNA
jgi:prolyl oligopeptidase